MAKYIVYISLFVSIVLTTGCMKNNPSSMNGQEDYTLVATVELQSGEDIAEDAAGMADAFSYTKAGIIQKRTTSDIQWHSWSYADEWWTRSGTISITAEGGELNLEGIDSVRFIDADDQAIQNPLLAAVRAGTIRHHATVHLEKTSGGFITTSRDWNLTGTVSAEGQTLTLNGSYAQTFGAENGDGSLYCHVNGTAQVSSLAFTKTLTGWSKPVAGTITVTSPYTTITISFTDGSAHIIVTDSDDTLINEVTIPL